MIPATWLHDHHSVVTYLLTVVWRTRVAVRAQTLLILRRILEIHLNQVWCEFIIIIFHSRRGPGFSEFTEKVPCWSDHHSCWSRTKKLLYRLQQYYCGHQIQPIATDIFVAVCHTPRYIVSSMHPDERSHVHNAAPSNAVLSTSPGRVDAKV